MNSGIQNKLNDMADRIKNVMNKVESVENVSFENVNTLLDSLEDKVSEYEDILKKEKKMS